MWNNVEKDTLAKKFDLLLLSLGGERCHDGNRRRKMNVWIRSRMITHEPTSPLTVVLSATVKKRSGQTARKKHTDIKRMLQPHHQTEDLSSLQLPICVFVVQHTKTNHIDLVIEYPFKTSCKFSTALTQIKSSANSLSFQMHIKAGGGKHAKLPQSPWTEVTTKSN